MPLVLKQIKYYFYPLIILITYNNIMAQTNSIDIYNFVEDKLNYEKVDEAFFDSLLFKQPNDDYLIGMKSYYLAKNKNVNNAEIFLKSKIISDISLQYSSFVNLGFGIISYFKNSIEEAKKYYDKSIQFDLHEKNKWVRLELYYYYKDIDRELAKKYLNKALAIDSSFLIAKIELAYIIYEEGKIDLAINALKNIIDKTSNSYANYLLGYIYLNIKNYSDAERYFKKSITIEPFALSYIGLGYIYQYYKQNNDSATIFYNNALKIDSTNSLPYFHLGVIFQKNKQYEEAIKNFNKVIEIKPDEKSFQQIVYSYALMKDYENAKKMNNRSIEFFGHNTDNDFWEILLFFLDNKDKEGEEKLKEFYENYTLPEIDWLKAELLAWGIKVQKKQ